MKQFKEYLQKRSDELGQELKIYASGSGALSYVWEYRSGPDKGNASGEKVTELDAVALFSTKDDGHYLQRYLLVELYGDYQIVQNITQISNNTFVMDFKQYVKIPSTKVSYGFRLFVIKDNDEHETLHSSTKSAIRFHCENSKDWKVVSILDKLELLK